MKALVVLVALTSVAFAADPPLPDAQKALVEKMGPIHGAPVYIAPAGKVPARWLVFVGGPSVALSAWVVTPGQGKREIAQVDRWPTAIKVVGVSLGTLPSGIPGNEKEPHAFVIVETLAASLIAQPAGIRTIIPINLPEPQYVAGVSNYAENVPYFIGAKDAQDVTAKLAAASKFWDEETADKMLVGDDDRTEKLVAKSKAKDAELAKLVPPQGIPIFESWQGTFARETARVTKIDASPDVAKIRAALDEKNCDWHHCGEALLGVEAGKVVIRAVVIEHAVAPAKQTRKTVTANAKDTQTAATANALGLGGKFVAEAPLGNGTGTIGVVDEKVIVRDGGYAIVHDVQAEGTPRFADLDGDGLTDVMFYKDRLEVVLALDGAFTDTRTAIEMTSLDKKTSDDVLAAALALPDDPITTKDACALLAQTAKNLDKTLAPKAEIFEFYEPSQPGIAPRKAITGKRRAKEIDGKTCRASCHARFPVCSNDHGYEGPGVDYYLFTRVKGAWKFLKIGVYRGA